MWTMLQNDHNSKKTKEFPDLPTAYQPSKRSGKILGKRPYTDEKVFPIGVHRNGGMYGGHFNAICSNYKCGYSRRLPLGSRSYINLTHTGYLHQPLNGFSPICPICSSKIVSIGNKAKTPKKGSDQRKKLLKAIVEKDSKLRLVDPRGHIVCTKLINGENQ